MPEQIATSQEVPELLAQHGLSRAEQDEMMLSSLLSGFDLTVYNIQAQEIADMDEQIMQQAIGVFDTASAFYSAESAQLLSVVEGLAQRLELLGCAHDHFVETVTNKKHEHDEHHLHEQHDHTDETEAAAERKKQKSKRTAPKRIAQRSFFEMVMSYFGRPHPNK